MIFWGIGTKKGGAIAKVGDDTTRKSEDLKERNMNAPKLCLYTQEG